MCARVVGIVADVHRFQPAGEAVDALLRPVRPGARDGRHGPRRSARTAIRRPPFRKVRKLLQQLDPTIAYVDATTLQDDIDPQVRPWRLGASVFGLMGVLALLVAAVGLYSVMSYLVAQRTHELGVRIALGASGGNIVSLVLRSSVGMALLGIAIGLGLALAAGRFIEPLLFNTSARDAVRARRRVGARCSRSRCSRACSRRCARRRGSDGGAACRCDVHWRTADMIRPGIRRLFRLAFHRREDAARDVRDEIRLHVELRTEQLIGGGMAPDEAREGSGTKVRIDRQCAPETRRTPQRTGRP